MSGSSFSLVTRSVEETAELAAKLSSQVKGGMLIGLSGPLGAGKTEFVRWFAKGLGVEESISSASYVLELIYPLSEGAASSVAGIKFLHHWDLYRLGDDFEANEVLHLQGDSSVITIVEWPEKVSEVEEALDLRLRLDYLGFADEEVGSREIEIWSDSVVVSL
ncbi:hypothetical protein BVY02_01825 [bacterium J17]|nr:hypothetical protein BVY02_01825 [bacterium J17]